MNYLLTKTSEYNNQTMSNKSELKKGEWKGIRSMKKVKSCKI